MISYSLRMSWNFVSIFCVLSHTDFIVHKKKNENRNYELMVKFMMIHEFFSPSTNRKRKRCSYRRMRSPTLWGFLYFCIGFRVGEYYSESWKMKMFWWTCVVFTFDKKRFTYNSTSLSLKLLYTSYLVSLSVLLFCPVTYSCWTSQASLATHVGDVNISSIIFSL